MEKKYNLLQAGKFSKGSDPLRVGKGRVITHVAEECWSVTREESGRMCL